jgi:uncharacterized protein YccT (UPF0319 family)
MQNLYMMATLVREQQMQEMAIKINQGNISVEQAMIAYNVSTQEAVVTRVEALKKQNKTVEKYQNEADHTTVLAA